MDNLSPIRLDSRWISRALLLSEEAGWNQTMDDWAVFFTHGTVLGITHDDRLLATSAMLPYGGDFGWLSMVLVTAEWRRLGLATRLVASCAALLRDQGKAALLDAAPEATKIYANSGFVPLCRMERWEGRGDGIATASKPVDLAHDAAAFGADRKFLLDDFLKRPGSLAFPSPRWVCLVASGCGCRAYRPHHCRYAQMLPLL